MRNSILSKYTHYWKKLSLQYKLCTLLAVVITIISSLAIYSFAVTNDYLIEFQNILKEHHLLNTFVTDIKTYDTLRENAIRDYSSQSWESKYNALLESDAKIRNDFLEIEEHYKSNSISIGIESIFEINALANTHDLYLRKTNESLLLFKEKNPDFYIANTIAQRVLVYVEQYIATLQRIRIADESLYYNSLVKQIAFTRSIMISIMIFATWIALQFSFSFIARFTSPLKKLAELSTSIATGNLSVPQIEIAEGNGDEIFKLTTAFNTMSRNIRNMIEDLKMKSQLEKMLHAEELEKKSAISSLREAQLVSLQTQINPHFLFNTLNVIGRQAQLENGNETVKLIHSLANLLRYNLISHKNSVSIKQELNAINEYITLQQCRFGARLKARISCEKSLEELQIPPLILLTFAENSVYHGLEPKINGGQISIDIKKRKNSAKIMIADTGIGMDKSTLNALNTTPDTLQRIQMDGLEKGIGVRNAITRLDLFYKNMQKIKFFSKQDRGTLIVLEIPYVL